MSNDKPKKGPGAFRTISEVSDDLDIPAHVLRFWETKFTHVRPMKRGGGRRYYRPEDVALLRQIQTLLYDEGYTIKGVQKLMKDGNLKKADIAPASPETGDSGAKLKADIEDAIRDLEDLKAEINSHR